jgi:hypothetical protein
MPEYQTRLDGGGCKSRPCPQCPVSDGRREKGGRSSWANRYLVDFAERLAVFLAGERCSLARDLASTSIIARRMLRSPANSAIRLARSASETFLFINVSFERAGNVDLLPLARKHAEPAAADEASGQRACPLTGSCAANPGKKGEGRGWRPVSSIVRSCGADAARA